MIKEGIATILYRLGRPVRQRQRWYGYLPSRKRHELLLILPKELQIVIDVNLRFSGYTDKQILFVTRAVKYIDFIQWRGRVIEIFQDARTEKKSFKDVVKRLKFAKSYGGYPNA